LEKSEITDEMRQALASFVMDRFNTVPAKGHFHFDEQDAEEALEMVIATMKTE
jgi:hypothetical protein